MNIYYDMQLFKTNRRPWIGELPHGTENDFHFIVMGDRSGFAIERVFEEALETAKRLNPDFIISVGDLIEGYWLEEEEANREWDKLDSHIHNAGLPFFQIPGNHDYSNEIMKKVWRERKGIDYYAFRYGKVLFLALHTEEPHHPISEKASLGFRATEQLSKREPDRAEEVIRTFLSNMAEQQTTEPIANNSEPCIGEEQFAFIEKTLQEHHDAQWTFVLTHRPLWKTDKDVYDRLIGMLGSRCCSLLSGHFHKLEYKELGGNHHIQMGRTGANKHKDGLDDFHHIMWVAVKNGQPSFTAIKLDGALPLRLFEL